MNKIITCLNNRVVKIILSLTLLVMMVCTIPKISDVNALSIPLIEDHSLR